MPSSLKAHLVAFFRAVGIGALAGGAPGLLITVPFGLMPISPPEGKWGWIELLPFIFSPLIISFLGCLVGGIFVGLPMFFHLRRSNQETKDQYTTTGIIAGALIGVLAGPVGSLLGMIAGGVTSNSWGKFRESLRADPVN